MNEVVPGRRSTLAALIAVLSLLSLGTPEASAGSGGCESIGRASSIQTSSPATCADAQALVPGYYSNSACFANGAPQACQQPARGKTWTCNANGASVSCSAPDPGSDVEGLVRWTDAPDTGPSRLTRLTLRPASFRAARSGGPVVAIGPSLVFYHLTKPGRATFVVVRLGAGRKVGPGPLGCQPQTPRNRTRPRCTIQRTLGSFTDRGVDGFNQFGFSGRLSGRRLAPGAYLLRARPEGSSVRTTRGFRILPPAR